jgi:hypothetical protein
MDVIGFLSGSLGSSTVQLHDKLGSDEHAHIQRLVSVVKMTTVLEECTTLEQRSLERFLWPEGLNAKDIHKEMFPAYSGSVYHVKRSTTGDERFADDEEVEMEVRE